MKLVPLLLLPSLALASTAPLFNGKDLAGWDQEDPRPSFAAVSGELRNLAVGHVPNWIHTTAEYEDFRLKFEYKLAQWAEAAVILRAPRSERPQHAGLTLVLAHDYHNETTPYITGALLGVLPPKRTFPASWNQWHTVEIEARGNHFNASIDGTLVQELDLAAVPELRHRLKRGVIGFPDMGYQYSVRNLEIEDLGSPTKFVQLMQDSALKGWEMRGASGDWRVRDGVIHAANGDSILYAPPAFQNFELTAVVRTHSRVNGGIFIRGDPTGPRRGFEVQIYSPVDSVYPTGSVYGRQRSRISADLENRWFLLQIRVQGSRCTVWLDGEPAADYEGFTAELLQPGRIGLQLHTVDAAIEFRDLRVREL